MTHYSFAEQLTITLTEIIFRRLKTIANLRGYQNLEHLTEYLLLKYYEEYACLLPSTDTEHKPQ